MFASSTFASVIPYNTTECVPQIAAKWKLFVNGNIKIPETETGSMVEFDITGMVNMMKDYLNQVEAPLIAMDDLLFKFHTAPLCVAMYADEKGPNASAISDLAVLFGFNLLHDLQDKWNIDGETGIKIILSHEYAHVMQERKNIPFNFPLKLVAQKRKELQADCVAGILLTFHYPKGKVIVESDEIMRFLADHHAIGDHGTYTERREAILTGMQEAIKFKLAGKNISNITSNNMFSACSEKYPGIP